MKSITSITIDTQNNKKFQKINAKEGDEDSRFICLTITSSGEPFPVDMAMRARMRCRTPGGRCFLTDCDIRSDGTVLAGIPNGAMEEPGLVLADIALYDQEDTYLATMTFGIHVKAAPYIPGRQ